MADKPDMAALQKALDEATEAKSKADREESYARLRTTDATNALNNAQKAFDAGVRAIRADVRRAGGDWSKEPAPPAAVEHVSL
jgi:hypothetical protein